MRQWLIIFFSILFLGHGCLEAKTAGCRFSADPLSEGSISITPYGYCGNNPLVRIDPDGRSFDRYQSDYGSVRWFRSSRERLFFHSEWWTRLGAEYSLELGDGRFLNFYQNVPVSLTDSRESALLGILNNDGFKGFLLSKDSPLDEEYRHDIVRRSIHHAQNEFLAHPLVRRTFDVLTFVGMGGVESLFSLSSSLCGFSGKHFGRTAIKTTLRAAKGSSNVLLNTSRQLQAKFKHAGDFGVVGNYSKANVGKFSSAINQHINSAGVQTIQGTYRGQSVIHYVNPNTGLNVISSPSGQFISGWKLNPVQLQNVLKHGGL